MANLTGASDMWKTWAWWKNFNLTRKIKALILNKYIRVNVRHRAFKCWLAQTSGFVLMATVAILYLTTEKNHPVIGFPALQNRVNSTNNLTLSLA